MPDRAQTTPPQWHGARTAAELAIDIRNGPSHIASCVNLIDQGFQDRMNEVKPTGEAAFVAIVRRSLTSEHPGIRLVDVRVRRDMGFDGDPILRIDVIFDGRPQDLNAGRLNNAALRVRELLVEDLQETAFPIFSFISLSDARRAKLVPA